MRGLRVKLAIYNYIKTLMNRMEHCLKAHILCGKLVQAILYIYIFFNFTFSNLL